MTGAEVVVRFFHDVDRQDWVALRSALTSTVDVDYSSLFGGEAETLAADDLIDRWQALIPGFDCTQHFLGPLIPSAGPVDAAMEQLECNVRAHHRLGTDEWLVAGRYTIGVRTSGEKAQISAITLHTAYQSGTTSLPEVAAERVPTKSP